jgi:Copper binding proteins, plastocyanin/azurin family
MSDTTTLDETSEEQLPALVESERLGAEGEAEDTPLKTRVLLPFLVPLLSILIVAVLVLNISRVFLAGDKDAALVMGIIITLSILIGASLIAAAPRLSTGALAIILGGVFVFVSIAGLISLGPSLNEGEGGGGFQYATGPAASTVSVTAGPGLTFNGVASTGKYPAKAGVVQINYGGESGHTLAIQDPKFDGFLLGTSAGARKSGKVKLTPGTYTIYCTVPGHEAAGMKATITVSG